MQYLRWALANWTKVNYENLKGLVKANDDILEKMDLLVEIIKKTNPDFYKGYKNTRRIIAKRTGKLALRAKVTSAYNGAEGLKVQGLQLCPT